MNKKVLKPLAFTVILFSVLFSTISCQMQSQADHYKKNGVAKRLAYLTYEVKYLANGGTGSCPLNNYKIGEEVQIRTNPYNAPTGLRFVCWNTKPDGSGSIYNPGDTFAMGSDDLILYAIWIDKAAHSITYYNTKGAANNNPYSFLESQSVSLNSLSLDYYTFGGWYTTSYYSGSPITGWNPGRFTSNLRLYAKWNPIQYSVTYIIGDGTIPGGYTNPSYFTIESNYTLRLPELPGYEFDGWFDEEGNQITVLDASLAGKNLVLTARYSLKRYTIRYHNYYGTLDVQNPESYTAEDEFELQNPARTDRIFLGWYNNPERRPQDQITRIERGTSGNLDIYTKWKNPVSTAYDIGENGVDSVSTWLASEIDTSRNDNKLELGGDITTNELHTLSDAIRNQSDYIEELDLTELNVVNFYNSGNGAGGDNFFGNLINVKKIILPESLEILSEGAFSYCTNLEEVVFHDYVTDILWSAFCGCGSLEEITIPDSVEFIAQTAFYECTSLKHVHLSKNSNLEIIGLQAFYYCTSLEDFYFPPKITYLDHRGATTTREESWWAGDEYGSFDFCSNLTTLTFSKNIQQIRPTTFTGCDSITTINYEGTEEEWALVQIGDNNGSLKTATINYNYDIP